MSNFMFNVSAEISAEVIGQMIKERAEKETGRKVERVSFNLGTKSDGFDRYSTDYLKGATVYFKQDTKL